MEVGQRADGEPGEEMGVLIGQNSDMKTRPHFLENDLAIEFRRLLPAFIPIRRRLPFLMPK